MALTQVETGGIKDDAVTAGKIPANAIGQSELADDAVAHNHIADGAVILAKVGDECVNEAKLQISNAGTNGQFLSKQSGNTGGLTWADSNNYTHPNHSGEVTSTGDGATVIADDVVDEANLKVSNSPTNGYALTAQSGNTGGLTWAEMAGGVDGIASSADATGLTIDSSEKFNFGYATNIAPYSAGSKVQIAGEDDSASLSIIRSDDGTEPARIYLTKSRGSNSSPTTVQNNSQIGEIVFACHDGTDFNNEIGKIEFRSQEGANMGSDDTAGHMQIYLTQDDPGGTATNVATDTWSFQNGGTIRMRLGDSNNYATIDGQSTASVTAYHLKGNGCATFSSSASNGNWTIFEVTGGSGKFEVRGHGHCLNTGNSWGSTSDEKAKENIVDAKSQWDDLKAIRVRNFNFKKEVSGESDVKMLGLVAQEAEKVCPSLVTDPTNEDGSANPDGYKTLKYSILYMKAIKALQEAMARIETLETKVAALEG